MDQGDAVDAHGMGALLERRPSSKSRSGAAVRLELLMICVSNCFSIGMIFWF